MFTKGDPGRSREIAFACAASQANVDMTQAINYLTG